MTDQIRFPSQTTNITSLTGTEYLLLNQARDTTISDLWKGPAGGGVITTVGFSIDSTYVVDGTTDDVQIQAAIDAVFAAGGGVVYGGVGVYDITDTISIKQNVEVILAEGAILRRNASFTASGSDHVVSLDGDNSTLRGGTVDGNSVALNPATQDVNINIGADGVQVIGTKSINAGDDCDACFFVGAFENRRLENCVGERNTDGHFYQFAGSVSQDCEGHVSDCRSKGGGSTTVQDGFRTYDYCNIYFTSCYAEQTRVGFQSWDSGNRDIYFNDCHARDNHNSGFQLLSNRSSITGGSSLRNGGFGLYVRESLCSVVGLQVSQNTMTYSTTTGILTAAGYSAGDGEVFISGNRNYVTGIRGESATSTSSVPGCIVTGNTNIVDARIHNTTTRKIVLDGDNNTVFAIGVTVDDNGSSNFQIGKQNVASTVTSYGAGANSISSTDEIIFKTAITGGGDTMTLPAVAGLTSGWSVEITDVGGGAGTNNITIATAGSETIDGASTKTISTNYGSKTIRFDGTNFFIVFEK